MANILSLAMKISADASGFKLDPVQRALQGLAAEAERVGQVFDEFAGTSEAAARAQARTAAELDRLTQARQAGTITAQEFAEQFSAVAEAASREAAALRRAAQITEQNLSPLQRYDATLVELQSHLDAGRISQETFNRANERAAQGLSDAERAARGFDVAVESTADNAAETTLQFNELSGIFAVLPGPLGNIAGRISGITSASEGLSRVFAGGLRQGISSVATSLASLINPLTVSIAGIAALGAAVTAITQGLIALEDRVEKLGNTADKLGVSFGFIQTLDEAARRSGTSIDAVSAAFGRLQRSVLGVDEESKAAQKALAEIGVTAEELQRLSPEEQYRLIGERIADIEDPARRTAAATALFGRAGADLVPFFNNIKGAADDIERFGKALSDAQRRDIDAFGASMDRVSVATTSAKEQLLAEFAPAATSTANTFAAAAGVVARNSDLFATGVSAVANILFSNLPTAISLLNTAVTFFDDGVTAADAASKNVQQNVELTAEQVAGLQKAFEASNKTLDDAINKAGEYGQAGFQAALQFQNAIKDLQDQVAENELNAEQYNRGVANATAEYDRQIESIRQVQEETKRLAEEAKRRAEAEAAAVQKIIDAYTEQIRIDEQFGGDSNRARAADNLTKLLAEQARVEEQLAAARAAGDQAAIDAATSRLAQIDQVAARERDIASGAAKAREEAEKAADKAAAERQRRFEQEAQAFARINEQILAKTQDFNDRQFEIARARAEELASIRTGSIEIQDIRSGGISAFFDTLTEDPAIAEAKRQTKELEKIRAELAKLQAERVDILAGNG